MDTLSSAQSRDHEECTQQANGNSHTLLALVSYFKSKLDSHCNIHHAIAADVFFLLAAFWTNDVQNQIHCETYSLHYVWC